MHKTQESLLARLMHMHELYEDEKKVIGEREQKMRLSTIEHKLAEFGKLNARMIQYLEAGVQTKTKAKASARLRSKKTVTR